MQHITRREALGVAAACGVVALSAIDGAAEEPKEDAVTKLLFVFDLSRITLDFTGGELIVEKGVSLEPTESRILALTVARKTISLSFQDHGTAKLHASVVTGGHAQGRVKIPRLEPRETGKLQIFRELPEGAPKLVREWTGVNDLSAEFVLEFAPAK